MLDCVIEFVSFTAVEALSSQASNLSNDNTTLHLGLWIRHFHNIFYMKNGRDSNKIVKIPLLQKGSMDTMPRGYKLFFVLSSAALKLKILITIKNMKKFSFFKALISLECYFSCS